jgi:hypothetical protein
MNTSKLSLALWSLHYDRTFIIVTEWLIYLGMGNILW